MAQQNHVYDFVFNLEDISNPIDQSNPIIQGYSEHLSISEDTAFYAELNRVLGNLATIRRAHIQIGVLVSFVVDSNKNSYKVTVM